MNKIAQVDIGSTFRSQFGQSSPLPQSTLGYAISLFVQIVFVLSGVLILFMVIFAGIKIVQGAGAGNPQEAEKGKQAATSALIGFVIIFSAYWIIKLIETITGVDFITNPGF